MLPFVGVDGEGGNITDPFTGFTTHEYTMLRVGNRYVTGDWLRFLATLPKKQIHVAYFFDYDVTMMLRDVGMDHLKRLVDGYPIYVGDYEVKYRPRKEFVVKTRNTVTTINDVGTFFQSRFLTALQRWKVGTPEQWDIIGKGKEDRAVFGGLTHDTVFYNKMECDLLVELMNKFRSVCQLIEYMPTRWQGPGQLAKAMFKKHGIPLTKDLPEPNLAGVWEFAQAAYYGGRFETSAVGPVRGPVEGWDINSAYPFAATLLPCLRHCHYAPTRTITDFGMYRVSFRHAREQQWYSLPIRTKDGSIRFPREGSGWYWGIELQSAIKLGARISVHHGFELVRDCDHTPFDFMHRLYSIRKAIGKSEAGMALKLAMNSAYGVCAQSVGAAPYANPIYAGLFTAITRARLNDAVAIDPYSVYMLATDGLFTAKGFPLEESATLGGWEKTVFPGGMFIVQPGVYFAGDKDPKTRGVPQTAIMREREALQDAWSGSRLDGHDIDLRQFIGLRLGVARNTPYDLGQWLPVRKRVSYDWSTKRNPRITRTGVEAIRTIPYDGDVKTWTVPYDKMIGGNLARDMDRLEFADTPDWAEALTEFL